MNYQNKNIDTLKSELHTTYTRLSEIEAQKLNLDLSRGKPSKLQLELSMEMLNTLSADSDLIAENGQDCRNYGGIDGIPEAKRLLAEMLGTKAENVIVGGNSSLTLMYQVLSHAMTHGLCGAAPWSQDEKRKFLCPVNPILTNGLHG